MIDRIAKKRRSEGQDVWGPNEVKKNRLTPKEIGTTLLRPFQMFLREPIVLCLSLLSGFADALIFTFIESYTREWRQASSMYIELMKHYQLYTVDGDSPQNRSGWPSSLS